MARVQGIDPNAASPLMRFVFHQVRKVFGKYAELRRHFSEEQLIELAADAAQENFRARWNRVFDVGSDALYCPVPKR